MDELYSLREVSELLKVNYTFLSKKITDTKFPKVKKGHGTYIKKSDIEDLKKLFVKFGKKPIPKRKKLLNVPSDLDCNLFYVSVFDGWHWIIKVVSLSKAKAISKVKELEDMGYIAHYKPHITKTAKARKAVGYNNPYEVLHII